MNRESPVIIGAGPAGLTAAYELGKRGLTSTVVEAGDQVGGICKTLGYRGYRFDIGGLGRTTDQEFISQTSRQECAIWSEARNRRGDADFADRAISLGFRTTRTGVPTWCWIHRGPH